MLIRFYFKKYARVVECFSQKADISLDCALDLFYRSEVYCFIRDGVSDLHCMSDDYLADELKAEYAEKFCHGKAEPQSSP